MLRATKRIIKEKTVIRFAGLYFSNEFPKTGYILKSENVPAIYSNS